MRPWIVALALITSACATVGLGRATDHNFRNLKVGQSSAEVIAQIGKPSRREGDRWQYEILRADRTQVDPYVLRFTNDQLTEIRFDTDRTRGDAEFRERRRLSDKNCVDSQKYFPRRQQSRDAPSSCDVTPPIRD